MLWVTGEALIREEGPWAEKCGRPGSWKDKKRNGPLQPPGRMQPWPLSDFSTVRTKSAR